MPSRDFPPSSSPPPPLHTQTHNLVAPLAGGIAAAASILLIFTFCFRKISRKRTVPSTDAESKPPHRFSYAALRRATSNFNPSLRLGQGGFGSVYSGTLKISGSQSDVAIAVKVMDSGSLQGEREFQNELLFAGKIESNYVVSIIGFSSDQRGRRMMLVYELMANGSLQDCLLHRNGVEDNGSVIEETESVTTTVNGFEEFHGGLEQSPESFVQIQASPETGMGVDLSPEAGHVVSPRTVAAMASPSEGLEKTSVSDANFDRFSVESSKEMSDKKGRMMMKKKSVSRNDWWWKQDTGGGESGPVKDYVMEWIGNEIKKERPRSEWIGQPSSSTVGATAKTEKKKHRKRLDWWVSLDDEKTAKMEKRRPAREWWKEEYCEELQRKKKKKKQQGQSSASDDCQSEYWPRDDEIGELWKARRNSYDSASGEIPKSGGISSTPSMRGTVCYAAPEYGITGDLSEKCDVYSYGVLLLVLIAGRRPLQVTGSPMSEFQRANLLSWARHLARVGKLLDLVDQSIESLNKEQALLCIKVALLCLQKSPARRPSMKEVVGVLSGELEPPELPVELSPSPPSRFAYKSHRKARSVLIFYPAVYASPLLLPVIRILTLCFSCLFKTCTKPVPWMVEGVKKVDKFQTPGLPQDMLVIVNLVLVPFVDMNCEPNLDS
nr:receptor-like serine/threonine-protein kinase At4g25390 [Ipomoea batatas]